MNQLMLSICEYPLTTILVDDNENFLSQLKLSLLRKDIASQMYSDPVKALNFVNNEYQPNPFTNRCISTNIDRNNDTLESHFDIRKIHHEIYNPKRFEQIGVLAVDYAMPKMSGLEFCQQINDNFNLKVILLTGEAGPGLAVEAFNQGYIDKYLQKSNKNLFLTITESINELRAKYFIYLSQLALNRAAAELYKQAPTCLSDPTFVSFFKEILLQNGIAEYYLTDEQGSFLLLDANAKPSWLAVADDEQMTVYHEIAKSGGASNPILDALKTRTRLPYFFSDKDFEAPPILWDEYLHDANVLEGKKRYYYSYINDSSKYHLDNEKILPYQKFMEKL